MQKQKPMVALGRLLSWGIIAIFILLPFHALLTAWFASSFGHFDVIRLWKEALLAVLAIISAVIVLRDKKLRAKLSGDKLFLIAGGFIIWILLMTLIGLATSSVNTEAAVYGLIIDTRFFVFMLITLIATYAGVFRKDWSSYILIPAFVVIGFGLLQLILPNDFLRHFGYGVETLQSFQAVDNKPDLARLQSTLRGPNPLGAYLVPIFVLCIAQALSGGKRKIAYLGAAIATLAVVFGTYSRSAWLGAAVATWFMLYFVIKNRSYKRLLYMATAGLVIAASSLIFLLRNNDNVQNLVFHTNELSGSSTSSNQQRGQALKNGLSDMYRQPLGDGVGGAGPASLRNDLGPSRISENFFIQIAQEAGIIGLILFVATLGLIAKRLLTNSPDFFSYTLLSALLGLAVVNMVSHAWADDTLAYVFFGLIGVGLGKKISTKSENLRYTET